MKITRLRIALTTITALVILGSLLSFSSGISGASVSGCTCHGASSTSTVIAVSGIPTTGYTYGTVYPITLTVTNMTKVAAGFDLSVSTGTLSVGTETGITLASATEMRHNVPRPMSSGTATWTFNWTAPSSGTATLTLNASCNAVNLSSTDAGDQWNKIINTYPLAPVVSAPTITTGVASLITTTSATTSVTANANGASTDVSIEYGLTTAYGSEMAAGTVTGSTATTLSPSLTGLTPGTLYHFRGKGVNSAGTTFGTDNTFTTAVSITAPDAVTGAASSITISSADVAGTIDANNGTTTVTFEYGTTVAYGSTQAATPASVSGDVVTPVAATLTGLAPGTLYHYRLRGGNSAGAGFGADMTFTTPISVSAPTAITSAASAITLTGATLNGSVNANNAVTSIVFQYGLTTAYGSTVAAVPASVSGTTLTPVTASISGLTPTTLYHYRISATNASGVTNSADGTFSTLTPGAIYDVAQGGFRLFPNPATNLLTITATESTDFDLVITDLQGRIMTVQLSGAGKTKTMDISSLAQGTYILSVKKNGTLYATPFVKK